MKIKDKFIGYCQKGMAFALAGTMAFSMSSCKKNIEEDVVGYLVEGDNAGLYSYVIDPDGFESDKYDFDSLRDVSFAKVDEQEEWGTKMSNHATNGFYGEHLHIVWPECYEQYDTSWLTTGFFDFEIITQQVQECAGPEFKVIYSSATAHRDLDIDDSYLTDGRKEIKKGDKLSSVAIYYEDDLICFNQSGAGSECQNVIDASVGDAEVALSTVKEAGYLDKTCQISWDELYGMQEEINEKIIHSQSKQRK